MAKRALLAPLAFLFLLATAVVHAGAYTGLAISKVWARDGQVVVLFDCAASLDPTLCTGCRAAYSQAADYKGILAVLLSAQAQGRHVTVHDAEGGTSLQTLIDSTVPNYWARPISLVAIEPD